MCTATSFETLFTWEIGRNAEGRRWFYKKLEQMISDIPEKGYRKVGSSVYIVREEYACKFEKLLLEFDGSNFTWQKFELKK